jgi:hypothetical protein
VKDKEKWPHCSNQAGSLTNLEAAASRDGQAGRTKSFSISGGAIQRQILRFNRFTVYDKI